MTTFWGSFVPCKVSSCRKEVRLSRCLLVISLPCRHTVRLLLERQLSLSFWQIFVSSTCIVLVLLANSTDTTRHKAPAAETKLQAVTHWRSGSLPPQNPMSPVALGSAHPQDSIPISCSRDKRQTRTNRDKPRAPPRWA